MEVPAVVVPTDQVTRTVSVRVTVSTTQITRVFSSATVASPFHTIAQLHRLHTAVIRLFSIRLKIPAVVCSTNKRSFALGIIVTISTLLLARSLCRAAR